MEIMTLKLQGHKKHPNEKGIQYIKMILSTTYSCGIIEEIGIQLP